MKGIYNDLRNKYLMLYKENEDINKENIHIYYEYNFIFGKYLVKRYELFYLCEMLNKKLDIIIELNDKNQDINLDVIDENLNLIFKDHIDNLSLMTKEYQAAIDFQKLPTLSLDEAKRIDEIFTFISKKINPNLFVLDGKTNKIWEKAKESFYSNDLQALEDIEYELVNNNITFEQKTKSIIDYDEMINFYKEKIEQLTSRIIYLKNDFPYNQKQVIASKELINKRLKELKKDIDLFTRRHLILLEMLDENMNIQKKYIC